VPNKTLPKILLIFLPIILVVFLLGLYLRAQNVNPETTVSEVVLTPTPTPLDFVPSKWAGDEDVISLESDLNSLEQKLQQVDLKMPQLLPPVLDMNINFK
jgi:hypothetical protein